MLALRVARSESQEGKNSKQGFKLIHCFRDSAVIERSNCKDLCRDEAGFNKVAACMVFDTRCWSYWDDAWRGIVVPPVIQTGLVSDMSEWVSERVADRVSKELYRSLFKLI